MSIEAFTLLSYVAFKIYLKKLQPIILSSNLHKRRVFTIPTTHQAVSILRKFVNCQDFYKIIIYFKPAFMKIKMKSVCREQ